MADILPAGQQIIIALVIGTDNQATLGIVADMVADKLIPLVADSTR